MSFEDTQYRDKPDMSYIWLKHLDRVNLMSGDEEGTYKAFVRQQFRLLPGHLQNWVLEQKDLFKKSVKKFIYQKTCGTNIGSEADPTLIDDLKPVKRLNDGTIDWNDPNIYSPKPMMVEEIDYENFNALILAAAERAGLSWKTDQVNAEYGLYPEKEGLDLGTPTPIDDPKKNDPPERNPLHHTCWINYKGQPKRVMNWRGYAVGINDNEKPWFFNEIAIRQTKQKPLVFLVTAQQGEGKTYAAIRLAEIFDKKFDPDKQIVMDRRNILKLVSGRGGLKRNQAIIIDESQWGASAREWGQKEQIKLMKFIAAARFKGYMIFIVSLHQSMLDNIIRLRIINYHIHMEERGRATVYKPSHQRFDEQRYPWKMGILVLQLPDYDTCDHTTCLTCDNAETCMTIRARYERNKTRFIESESEKDAVEERQQAALEMGDKELAELCVPHVKTRINTNTKGFYITGDIRLTLFEEHGLEIPEKKAVRVRAFLMRLAPPRLLA